MSWIECAAVRDRHAGWEWSYCRELDEAPEVAVLQLLLDISLQKTEIS